jgi:hypothetical protein
MSEAPAPLYTEMARPLILKALASGPKPAWDLIGRVARAKGIDEKPLLLVIEHMEDLGEITVDSDEMVTRGRTIGERTL